MSKSNPSKTRIAVELFLMLVCISSAWPLTAMLLPTKPRSCSAPVPGISLRLPLPEGAFHVTSLFGMRMHPVLRLLRLHRGLDLGARTGTPILAVADGEVASVGYNALAGNYVVLRHAGDLRTSYSHASRIATGIKAGVHVHQGQQIAAVGSTGLARGAHLHYEVRYDGDSIDPVSLCHVSAGTSRCFDFLAPKRLPVLAFCNPIHSTPKKHLSRAAHAHPKSQNSLKRGGL